VPRRSAGLKRRNDVSPLESMSDDELAAVSFFANLVSDSGEVLFTATPAEQAEAWALLKAREGRAASPGAAHE
jgi:hypothetical protein